MDFLKNSSFFSGVITKKQARGSPCILPRAWALEKFKTPGAW